MFKLHLLLLYLYLAYEKNIRNIAIIWLRLRAYGTQFAQQRQALVLGAILKDTVTKIN